MTPAAGWRFQRRSARPPETRQHDDERNHGPRRSPASRIVISALEFHREATPVFDGNEKGPREKERSLMEAHRGQKEYDIDAARNRGKPPRDKW